MMTAMLTARNILSGKQSCDTWKVNRNAGYREEKLIKSTWIATARMANSGNLLST
jgi:hypothetical protein